jgi:hypothetical protein
MGFQVAKPLRQHIMVLISGHGHVVHIGPREGRNAISFVASSVEVIG